MAYQRILVPVDGSATSDKALAAALRLARESDGRIKLLHTVDEMAYMGGYEYAGDLAEYARENGKKVLAAGLAASAAAGVQAESELVDTIGQRLGDTVAQQARQWPADLVVVGTHGRRGIGRVLLGSGAEQIIRLAPVPVLVIRGEEPD
jgi:nucleotide-binding universal stress UspA family protein